jgi:diguanylate cyclase (GGDEF)-like protein
MIRLLICDDSESFRFVLRTTLAEQPEISVVGEAGDGREAVDLALALSPDAILMDVRMPVLDGIEATREIIAALPTARIVGLTGFDDRQVTATMLEAGAAACCVKGAPLWELERAIAGAAEPLVRLAHCLTRAANTPGIGELVARELTQLTGGAGAAVYFAAPDVGLSLASAAGPGLEAHPASAPGVVLESFRTRRLVLASHAQLAELAAGGLPCKEALAAPLLDDGETFGAVLVVIPTTIDLLIDHELVVAVADLAASTVASERHRALTRDEARRDSLTGLPNRRAFEERLGALLAERSGRPVGLALVDLDDFKRVNHTRGHLTGDDVLRETARVLARTARANEEVFRLGGDELAVLVPGGRSPAKLVANRMVAGLRGHRRGLPLPSASAGIAAFPEDGETPDEILARAEIALREAKAEGGGRVVDLPSNRSSRLVPEVAPASGALAGPAPGKDSLPRVVALPLPTPGRGSPQPRPGPLRPVRVLVVDDDERLRILLRTTLEVIDIEIDEAESVPAARACIAERRPDVVVLDLSLPGPGGLLLCEELKRDAETRDIGIVVLTGSDVGSEATARGAGADAFLRKPFSPLELLAVVERLAGGLYEGPFRIADERPPDEQLIRYAEDLRRLLALEQGQRVLIQKAYRETVGALASALEAKDLSTNAHSHRVQQYAMELAWAVEPRLVEEPSVEFGFLLHDVGKIGIPDRILNKPGLLTEAERRILETHVVLGEQMLEGVALLQGGGLQVVRYHHERWDGDGYPDRLGGYDIPLPARIFAVADALDAMTSDRPYRPARAWDEAMVELIAQSGSQFDPNVVEALRQREARLQAIHADFVAAKPPRALELLPDEEEP